MSPGPHFNTVSTMVRSLEKKGFTTHMAEGLSYRYAPTMGPGNSTVRDIWAESIRDYLDNSYKKVVSQFVEDERISLEELKDLVRMIEKDRRRK